MAMVAKTLDMFCLFFFGFGNLCCWKLVFLRSLASLKPRSQWNSDSLVFFVVVWVY